MDKLELKGKITEIKGKLKKNYGMLTDNDLAYEDGQDDEFIGRIAQKVGKAKDAISKEINSWFSEP